MSQPTDASPDALVPTALPRAAVLAVVIALAALAAGMSWHASGVVLRPAVVDQDTLKAWDVWFDGDLPDYYAVAINRWSLAQRRAERHPLIGYVVTVPSLALQPLVRDPMTRVRVLLAGTSALVGTGAGVLLLAITGRALPALVFGALWVVSAQFVFWCGVIDTFLFGQLSLLIPLLVVRFRAALGRGFEAAVTLAVAASMAVTVTNAMAGLAVAALALPPRRAAQAIANGLLLVLLAFGLLPFVCPGAEGISLFQHRHTLDLQGNLKFLNRRPIETIYHVTLAGVVAPEVDLDGGAPGVEPARRVLCFHADQIGRNGALFGVIVALWLPLLGLGLVGLARGSFDPTFRLALAAILAGQVALHLVYGTYQFLYVAHSVPLVILVGAHAARWWPRLALALAGTLVPLLLLRNLGELGDCARLLHQIVGA